MSRPGAGRSGACKGRKCPEGPPEQLGGHSSYPSRGMAGHMERGAISERPSAGPLGHPCGDREQVGRPTRQEGEGQCGWRQRFHGRGNGSEERGARAQRPLPPPNLCRCRPAPTPQTLRPVGAMTGGPGDREQRPEPTCGLHGGSLSVRKLNSRTRPRARSPLRTFLKALKKRGRPPFCPLATSCRRIRTPTYAHAHHGPQRSERGGARYVLENLGDRVGPVPLADGLALADSHLCCKRHVWLVTALPPPPKRPVLPRVALGTL